MTAQPLFHFETEFIRVSLAPHIYGSYLDNPGYTSVISLNDRAAMPEPIIIRQLYYWLSRIKDKAGPYDLYACETIQPGQEVEQLPQACNNCPVKNKRRAICPRTIILEQTSEKRRLALLMGFRIIK